MKGRYLTLLGFFMFFVAVANSDPQPVQEVKVPVERVVIKTRTVVKEVRTGKIPSGRMTEDQCRSIKEGMDFRDLLHQYGWPDGEGLDSLSIMSWRYPIAGQPSMACWVDLWDNKVESVELEERL